MQSKTWQVPKIWEGGEVFILGGGPSIIETFNIPGETVKSVRLQQQGLEAYSPYFASLYSKHVIGINVAYKLGNWVDICFFGDYPFFLTHRKGLAAFEKLVVTSCTKVGNKNLEWIKYLPQELKKDKPQGQQTHGISTNPNHVSWNQNSGAAAISIAAWSGAKRIVLVGFDMNLSPLNNEQHFHNEYRRFGSKERKDKQLPFDVHLRTWGVIKSDADNMGIEILNTSLNSAIKEIPKVHIKELL